MQVTSVRTTVVGTPWRDLVFVELETDTAWSGSVRSAAQQDRTRSWPRSRGWPRRYVIGTDPFDTERLAWAVERARIRTTGRVRPVGPGRLRHRLVGPHRPDARRAGLEAPRRAVRDRVPAYANGWYKADLEPDRIARLAAEVVGARLPRDEARSVRGGQRRLTNADRGRALAVVAAVREAIGPDIDLMIEMHGRFSPDTAARLAVALEPYAPRWIEEPVPPENAAALAPRPARRHLDRDRRARSSNGMRPRSSKAATSTSSRPT